MSTSKSSSSKTSISSLLILSSATTRSEYLQTSSSSSVQTNVSRLTGGQDSKNPTKRLDTVLDIMEDHMNSFYKNLLSLQKKRDFLLLSIKIVQHNDVLTQMSTADRADITAYIKMIEDQLSSVQLFASRSKRVDSLKRINELIDAMLTLGNIIKSNEFCTIYLRACESFADIGSAQNRAWSNIFAEITKEKYVEQSTYKILIEREFKALLTGCKEKDRKDVYERLLSIQKHLKFQLSKRERKN